ncbi:MAG: ABC transporter substrate-binding protein [Dehalococcoidia bacterium]
MHRSSLILLSALLLAACTPTTTPAAPAPGATAAATASGRAERQVLRVGTSSGPGNMTPQGGTFFPEFYAPLYDMLTEFGPGFVPRPAVAEKWDVSADGLTWTFNLRKDVKWPDGSALTADDIVYTMNTIFELKWPQTSLFGSVGETISVDPATVQIKTKVVDMAIPNNAASFRIIPKAYFSQVGFEGFVQKPVGSGPYELVEYKAGDIIRFKKRAQKHAFRNPPIDELIFRSIPDPAQQLNGLRTGELDMITGNFPVDQLELLQRNGMQVIQAERTSSHVNFPYSTYEAKNSPLKDKRVREAINYAVDKETMSKAIFRGFNRPVGQMGTPGSPWWDDSVQPIPFNVARAKQLLSEAGYPNGFKVTMDLQPGQIPQEMVLAVQSNLRDVGIDVELVQNEQAGFLDKYFARTQKGDLFPLVSGETNGFFQSLRNAYTCTPPGGQGLGIYCNQQVDKLLTDAFAERDATKRAQIFKEANRIMRADFPQLWLVTLNSANVLAPKVRGFTLVTPTQNTFDAIWIAS